MDPFEMKRLYGDKVTFYGGVDVERTMPFGTPDEVRAEIRLLGKRTWQRRRLHPADQSSGSLGHADGEHHRVHRGGAGDGWVGDAADGQ